MIDFTTVQTYPASSVIPALETKITQLTGEITQLETDKKKLVWITGAVLIAGLGFTIYQIYTYYHENKKQTNHQGRN